MKIILFDGICNLCNGIVLFIIKKDKKDLFRFAALQSESGRILLQEYSLPEEDGNTLYYICNDKYYKKSTAILHILRELNGGWQFFYFLIWIPAGIRDAIYSLISHNRYRLFGKRTSCLIPSPEIRRKFME